MTSANTEKSLAEDRGAATPKISVIVPVYKVEKYLPECIESVLAQTFTDFELILVDDGSPDNSGAICDAYAARDSRIRVFHKPNGGVSSARNLGLDHARGEWIALLDGDDFWLPNHLDNFSRAIDQFPQAKVFYTGYTNSRIRNFKPIRSLFAFRVEDYWALALNGTAIWTSCVCVYASVIKNRAWFRTDLTHGEDLDIWRRLVKEHDAIMIPEVTAVYRIGSENSAVRKVPLPQKTIIWDLNFSKMSDEKELLYFTRIYYGFLFRYFPLHLILFFRLLRKKRFRALSGFPLFWLEMNLQRLKRRFL